MLKGEAKKEYQREYMRKYMKDHRLKPLRPTVKTLVVEPVKTPEVVVEAVKTCHPIGIPVRPTDKQKSEWAKFKAGQRDQVYVTTIVRPTTFNLASFLLHLF